MDVSKGVDVVREAINIKLVIVKASVSILMLQGVRTFLYMCVYIYMYIHIRLSPFFLVHTYTSTSLYTTYLHVQVTLDMGIEAPVNATIVLDSQIEPMSTCLDSRSTSKLSWAGSNKIEIMSMRLPISTTL